MCVFLAFGCAVAWAGARRPPGETASTPFLETLLTTEGGVVVAYGTDATSRRAARIVRTAIRSVPGQESWDGMRQAASFDAEKPSVTGQTHIIAVGTMRDNVLFSGRHMLPAWWLDRTWYHQEYEYAVPAEEALEYMPTRGFVAGGFGEWAEEQRGIGYVEIDRSFYFMEWMIRQRLGDYSGDRRRRDLVHALRHVKEPTYPKDFPLRLFVTITGSGGPGVVAAARAFAERGMLNGVVLAEGASADTKPKMFTLPPARYLSRLPFKPPEGADGYQYQGWLLADAFQYDGFTHDAGVEPELMLRIKYKPPFGITNFWSSPHRMASNFEVCALRFASAGEARRAREGLRGALEDVPRRKPGRVKGLTILLEGRYLYMESIPEPAGERILKRMVSSISHTW
jgi:hypothetical protein